MIKLSLKKEKFDLYVDYERDKKGLEGLTGMQFNNLSEFSDNIRKYNCHVDKNLGVISAFIEPRITELPFTLKKLPVFYSDPREMRSSGMYIGNVEVVD